MIRTVDQRVRKSQRPHGLVRNAENRIGYVLSVPFYILKINSINFLLLANKRCRSIVSLICPRRTVLYIRYQLLWVSSSIKLVFACLPPIGVVKGQSWRLLNTASTGL
ncbi:unnamed protein product [Musa acuminata var. zebrina]